MKIEAVHFRNQLYDQIRTFFKAEKVLEVSTPILSKGHAVDAFIDPFQTCDSLPLYYLQTSPELYMKQLLLKDYPSIFQIAKSFRQHEQGRLHHIEFEMLEWYRLNFSMEQLMQEVAIICRIALGEIEIKLHRYEGLFLQVINLSPFNHNQSDFEHYLLKQNIDYPSFLDLDEALNFILATVIEPKLEKGILHFIYHYPESQASLSKINPQNQHEAKRFEAFYNGVELCNGFEELQEGEEYNRRFELENEKRKAYGKPLIKLDTVFLENIIQKPLPACSGAALGLDRLILLALKKQHIKEVIFM